MDVYVTVSLKATARTIKEAQDWADLIGAIFVTRQKRTIPQLLQEYGIKAILVYSSDGPEIVTEQGRHAFHLSMAELRIQHIRQGKQDHLLEAVGAHGPLRVLDCTCGFGADSLVLSFGLPEGSQVDALESSPFLSAVTAWGFRHFIHKNPDVTAALRRISLRGGTYEDYLSEPRTDSYDVLYFDPMFSHPVETSPQFQPVRSIMDMDQTILTKTALDMALNRAKKKVIIKARRFHQLAPSNSGGTFYGGKYSRIGYAVWECAQ